MGLARRTILRSVSRLQASKHADQIVAELNALGDELASERDLVTTLGQRAAALLFMLLQQPGGPLIIDQPEGDLDNTVISELAAKLHLAKQKRQIIFASHNANIVVNGSSELVVHLRPNDTGHREIEMSGAIDEPPVRALITTTMEGGQKAFRDRLDKYGF